MRRWFPIALFLAGCGTTPSADGSRRPSPRRPEPSPRSTERSVVQQEPRPAEDVPDDALAAAARSAGCDGSDGSAALVCRDLEAFRGGATPDLRPGTMEGVVLPLGRHVPAAVAVLAVRSDATALEVGWAVVRPNDPADASRLAVIAADLIAGHPPAVSIGLEPNLAWSRPRRCTGPSLRLESEPPIFLRQAQGALLALVQDPGAPLLAVHRTGSGQ